jgi:hypothetical protein
MTSDYRLLRAVAAQSGMGAILGALFFGVMLFADMFGIRTAIFGAEFPLTTLLIFGVVVASHFAFGAAITGFLFLISDGVPDEKDPS